MPEITILNSAFGHLHHRVTTDKSGGLMDMTEDDDKVCLLDCSFTRLLLRGSFVPHRTERDSRGQPGRPKNKDHGQPVSSLNLQGRTGRVKST
jgi:hypothetical protein